MREGGAEECSLRLVSPLGCVRPASSVSSSEGPQRRCRRCRSRDLVNLAESTFVGDSKLSSGHLSFSFRPPAAFKSAGATGRRGARFLARRTHTWTPPRPACCVLAVLRLPFRAGTGRHGQRISSGSGSGSGANGGSCSRTQRRRML